MKSAGKARSNGLYRHIRTSKEIIRNLLNDSDNYKGYQANFPVVDSWKSKRNKFIGIQLIVLCYLKVTWYDMFRSASCCYNIVTAMNQTSRAEKRKEKQKMYTVTFSNEELEEMKANDAVVIVSCDDDNGHRLY